jgi:3-phosphoglycerate kinase
LKKKTCMVVDEEIPGELHGFDIGQKPWKVYILHKGKGVISGMVLRSFEVDDFSAGTTHIARASSCQLCERQLWQAVKP